jgi:hypothetical protein
MEDTENDFLVILKGLKIPQEASKRMATEIKEVVLRELASLDFEGDLVIKRLPKGREFLSQIGPTDGIWTEVKSQ